MVSRGEGDLLGMVCANAVIDEGVKRVRAGSVADVRSFPAASAAMSSSSQRFIRAVCCCEVSGEFGSVMNIARLRRAANDVIPTVRS